MGATSQATATTAFIQAHLPCRFRVADSSLFMEISNDRKYGCTSSCLCRFATNWMSDQNAINNDSRDKDSGNCRRSRCCIRIVTVLRNPMLKHNIHSIVLMMHVVSKAVQPSLISYIRTKLELWSHLRQLHLITQQMNLSLAHNVLHFICFLFCFRFLLQVKNSVTSNTTNIFAVEFYSNFSFSVLTYLFFVSFKVILNRQDVHL